LVDKFLGKAPLKIINRQKKHKFYEFLKNDSPCEMNFSEKVCMNKLHSNILTQTCQNF